VSVSEWVSCHSLTLAATPEMKKVRENWHRDGLLKCPGACSGDSYFDRFRRPGLIPLFNR
jgi:hypothetical protein